MVIGRAVRSIILSTIIACAVVTEALPAMAWTSQGHRLIAHIAYERLDPKAKVAVDQLIAEAGNSLNTPQCAINNFSEASTWADCIRGHKLPGVTRHTDPAPVCREEPREKWCKGRCASEQVVNAEKVLSDRSRSPVDRMRALAMIVHLVGDLHQPMHVKEGRYQVLVGGKEHNLHAYWDSNVLKTARKLGPGKDGRILQLVGANPTDWTSGNILSWAGESQSIAANFAIPAAGIAMCPPPKTAIEIPSDYTQAASEVAAEQVAKAGVRLAWLLNQLLD